MIAEGSGLGMSMGMSFEQVDEISQRLENVRNTDEEGFKRLINSMLTASKRVNKGTSVEDFTSQNPHLACSLSSKGIDYRPVGNGGRNNIFITRWGDDNPFPDMCLFKIRYACLEPEKSKLSIALNDRVNFGTFSGLTDLCGVEQMPIRRTVRTPLMEFKDEGKRIFDLEKNKVKLYVGPFTGGDREIYLNDVLVLLNHMHNNVMGTVDNAIPVSYNLFNRVFSLFDEMRLKNPNYVGNVLNMFDSVSRNGFEAEVDSPLFSGDVLPAYEMVDQNDREGVDFILRKELNLEHIENIVRYSSGKTGIYFDAELDRVGLNSWFRSGSEFSVGGGPFVPHISSKTLKESVVDDSLKSRMVPGSKILIHTPHAFNMLSLRGDDVYVEGSDQSVASLKRKGIVIPSEEDSGKRERSVGISLANEINRQMLFSTHTHAFYDNDGLKHSCVLRPYERKLVIEVVKGAKNLMAEDYRTRPEDMREAIIIVQDGMINEFLKSSEKDRD